MLAILLAVVLAFIIQLAIWEGVVLGAVWLINLTAGTSIGFIIPALVVAALWALIATVKILIIYGTYKESGRF